MFYVKENKFDDCYNLCSQVVDNLKNILLILNKIFYNTLPVG